MSVSTSISARIRRRRLMPWAVPVVAVVAVTAVSLAPRAFAGDTHPSLPARSAADLIALVDSSTVHAFSGTVQSTPNLGLPQLPGSDGGNVLSALLTQPSSLRVSVDGQRKTRIAVTDGGSEMDVIRNGRDVWVWNSSTQTATHYVSADDSTSTTKGTSTTASPSPAAELTPQAMAQKLLADITPSTGVTVGQTAVVAGRNAYTLVITPKTSATLIGEADIWIDSATGLPLGVELFPRGSSSAALTEKFSQLSLSTPAARTFTFTAPRGASVSTPTSSSAGTSGSTGSAAATPAKSSTSGTGWTTIGVYPTSGLSDIPVLGSLVGSESASGSTATSGMHTRSLLNAATTAGPNGSREIQTRLFSVLITQGGTAVIGAVPVKALETVAATVS